MCQSLDQNTTNGQITTFERYATKIFLPYINKQLRPVSRIDIIFDVNIEDSFKSQTKSQLDGLANLYKSFLGRSEYRQHNHGTTYYVLQISPISFESIHIFKAYGCLLRLNINISHVS